MRYVHPKRNTPNTMLLNPKAGRVSSRGFVAASSALNHDEIGNALRDHGSEPLSMAAARKLLPELRKIIKSRGITTVVIVQSPLISMANQLSP
jgi:hypothetical protein